jgi:putative transposase
MRKYHVPFWRAVEEATPSLTLIIKRVGLGLFPTIKRRRGNLVVIESTTNSTLKEVLETLKCARSLHRPEGRCR